MCADRAHKARGQHRRLKMGFRSALLIVASEKNEENGVGVICFVKKKPLQIKTMEMHVSHHCDTNSKRRMRKPMGPCPLSSLQRRAAAAAAAEEVFVVCRARRRHRHACAWSIGHIMVGYEF